LITELGDKYYAAELALLRSVAKRLQVGLGEPTYIEQQQKQARYFQADVIATLQGIRLQRQRLVDKTLGFAYKRGVLNTISRIAGDQKPLKKPSLDRVKKRVSDRMNHYENVAMAEARKKYMRIIHIAGEKAGTNSINITHVQYALWTIGNLL